jgi:hypothetical protein
MSREDADIKQLNALVGAWTMVARPPDDSPWLGGTGRSQFEWLDGEKFLIQRWTFEVPEVPDGIAIIGADNAARGVQQHYFDSRGVHRVYELSLFEGTWKLWRDSADPFPQRYIGVFSDGGKTITGRWEKDEQGGGWTTDFSLNYRKVE